MNLKFWLVARADVANIDVKSGAAGLSIHPDDFIDGDFVFGPFGSIDETLSQAVSRWDDAFEWILFEIEPRDEKHARDIMLHGWRLEMDNAPILHAVTVSPLPI